MNEESRKAGTEGGRGAEVRRQRSAVRDQPERREHPQISQMTQISGGGRALSRTAARRAALHAGHPLEGRAPSRPLPFDSLPQIGNRQSEIGNVPLVGGAFQPREPHRSQKGKQPGITRSTRIFGGSMNEERRKAGTEAGQRSEVRRQKSAVRDQRSEVSGQPEQRPSAAGGETPAAKTSKPCLSRAVPREKKPPSRFPPLGNSASLSAFEMR